LFQSDTELQDLIIPLEISSGDAGLFMLCL
jgi:hypothetical protein